MKLTRLVLACSVLSCVLAGHAIARDAATGHGRSPTGTVGADTATPPKGAGHASSKDNPRKSDDNAGRKGVSCQRDIFFKGDDGQMHLCK
ncbi:hypothetical protein MTX26_13085 [Bradyrhizobium sp. ISRA443]|uniref:hypothetical protein n=1 Tax=unclassified Bradyrhizobium TaxID=2631580 RepID=UPI002479DF18|nr:MULTISPECIES: hypothetical protein [unclassified Bradyrhizobium]WGR91436.1 hypothetical protein MTX20_23570 [Bradyrhizobium sp. ISRA435]WGS01691.1 hypothetical protein MTX23_13095 [Bradyrhizobium sp. ISRA436]WGS08577.1 hypothetical protein MTX18_13085 [Bradyrhizobium sp. ISRA437]WGS15465.1 hypothetical protein MTX26_13085 [Bradyrhizobium sp. ISRA443]